MITNLKYILLFTLGCLLVDYAKGQVNIPAYYQHDEGFSDSLKNIIEEVGLDSTFKVCEDGVTPISFAVIDLSGEQPLLGGVHYDHFIYPASVYKMYIAMEVLKQVSHGDYSLHKSYIVRSPNEVDTVKEISCDPRPLLREGDTVTVNYLLDLMITRSDNSAANCLIDIARRGNINKTIHENGWQSSEVTSKFLKRKYEDPGYETVKGTVTSALHAADFMYKLAHNQLVNPWVSMQMEALLAKQLDTTKLSTGLPQHAMFYHKTGWWNFYTHDVGIVDDGQIKYVISLFTPLREEEARPRLKEVSKRVYHLIKNKHSG